jgi:hypothetical protein
VKRGDKTFSASSAAQKKDDASPGGPASSERRMEVTLCWVTRSYLRTQTLRKP